MNPSNRSNLTGLLAWAAAKKLSNFADTRVNNFLENPPKAGGMQIESPSNHREALVRD